MAEAVTVVCDTLQQYKEESLAVDDLCGALSAEASNNLPWVTEVHDIVCQHILHDQTHLLDNLSGCGFVHTKQVGNCVEAVGG